MDQAIDSEREPHIRGWRTGRWVFGLLVVVQLVALYWPRVDIHGPVTWTDKVVHAALFAAPTVAGMLAGLRPAYLAAAFAVHAPLSELLQHDLLPHRTGDPLDAVADLVGVGLGAVMGVVWTRLRRW